MRTTGLLDVSAFTLHQPTSPAAFGVDACHSQRRPFSTSVALLAYVVASVACCALPTGSAAPRSAASASHARSAAYTSQLSIVCVNAYTALSWNVCVRYPAGALA